LQDPVVVLAGVGHPDEAGIGGRQQQRADRTVDDPVGDVEDAAGLHRGGEPVA
jgi:hypothetical protein